MSLKSRIKS